MYDNDELKDSNTIREPYPLGPHREMAGDDMAREVCLYASAGA